MRSGLPAMMTSRSSPDSPPPVSGALTSSMSTVLLTSTSTTTPMTWCATQAMKKYDYLMTETFGRSIHRHLTISSYADNYFIRNGCYTDVYECKGNLRLYLSNAIYGGRVNVLERIKKTCLNERINDFDGLCESHIEGLDSP